MRLYCSNAIQAKLGCKCDKQPAPTDPLDSWYAHLITVRRRNIVVVTLLDFRFVILIAGVKEKQWAGIEGTILQRIRETLQAYEIPAEALDAYLPADTVFAKCAAAEPRERARLSSVVKQVRQVLLDDPDAQRLQNGINATSGTAGDGKVNYWVPARELKRALLLRYGVPIPAVELEFSLNLERYEARRTLIVPADTTFWALDDYLQTAYRWHRGHHHMFTLPPVPNRETPSLIAPAGLGECYASPEEQVFDERQTHLLDLLQEGDTFQYSYDFGDGWEIQCRLTRCLPNYPDPLPACTLLEGAAPPEDVGGLPGFLAFLDILSNKEDPAYMDTMLRGGRYWSIPWTMEHINYLYRDRHYSIR